MNPILTLPAIIELGTDPLGVPILIAILVVIAWSVAALMEGDSRDKQRETSGEHERRRGWW